MRALYIAMQAEAQGILDSLNATLLPNQPVIGRYYQAQDPRSGALRAPDINDRSSENSATIQRRHGGRLPHWTKEYATYAITFRLADSLPNSVLEHHFQESERLQKLISTSEEGIAKEAKARLQEHQSTHLEAALNKQEGACWLKDPEVAKIVTETIQHFEGERYELGAWCIMPNHVHLIIQPYPHHELADILASIKKYSAREANLHLKREGHFWQKESYDHIIRHLEDFRAQTKYIEENPVKANLSNWSFQGSGALRAPDINDRSSENSATILIATSGKDRATGSDCIGTEPAALIANDLITNHGVTTILNAGTCGAHSSLDATIADPFLISPTIFSHDHRIPLPKMAEFGMGSHPTAPEILDLAEQLNFPTAILSSGNSLDHTERDLEIFLQNGAQLKDMEGSALAWVCRQHDVPLICLKVVTDIFDLPHPAAEQFAANLAQASEKLTIEALRLLQS